MGAKICIAPLAGLPCAAESPALCAVCAGYLFANTAAAKGLRQVLPVQTNKILMPYPPPHTCGPHTCGEHT
ncbi:MAG: hypothetical protein LBB50_02975, partial [Oscillospiraceae bacterium]|nr:hypothetical protein [Oscillospiraceae bacterium]